MSNWTAASSDCSRPANNYVRVNTVDLYTPNARFTPERLGYQVLTLFGKLGYSHFSTVSTHFAWEPPPRITDNVAELETPQPSFLETRPDYVELALTVPQGQKRDFFVTLAYEWELMLEAFRHRVDPGFVTVIYGDHQPPFITDGRGGNDVAVHVVTDIPDLSGLLAAAGFITGGDIPWASAVETFRLEAFYPFVVSLLSTEGGASLEFSPTGLDLPAVPTW